MGCAIVNHAEEEFVGMRDMKPGAVGQIVSSNVSLDGLIVGCADTDRGKVVIAVGDNRSWAQSGDYNFTVRILPPGTLLKIT